MKMNENSEEIDRALQKICEHPSFEKSPRNVRLLKFLVHEAKLGNDVKEHIIGVELFEQRYNPDKNDGKVRVYMYNLRKKLAEYYDTVGREEVIVFKIEKGQYNLSFAERGEGARRPSDILLKIEITKKQLSIGILSFLLIFLVALIYPKEDVYVWDSFFYSKSNTIVVVADHLMLSQEQANGKRQPTFISGINSENDLLKYISENEIQGLGATDYTMMTKMAPFAIHLLTEWFARHDKHFELRLESEFRLEEIRNHNIIYVGQNKTMKTSKALFLRDSEQFEVFRDGYTSTVGKEINTYATTFENDARVEYAMVSFAALENGNKALFLTSNNDIGTLATVRNFTNINWLKKFNNNFSDDDTFFNALFEVGGLRRTDTSCSLVELEIL